MILLDDKNVNSVTRQLICNGLILLFIYTVMSVSASNTHTKRYRQATNMYSLQINQIFNASVKQGDNIIFKIVKSKVGNLCAFVTEHNKTKSL